MLTNHAKPSPKHKQVPFVTSKGHVTEVDDGIYFVLKLLREAGVETQFSCEGGTFATYVLADLRSSYRLILKSLFARNLSDEAKATRRRFLKGTWLLDIVGHNEHGEWWRKKFHLGPDDAQRHAIEFTWSNFYGWRVVFRWPLWYTAEVEDFLIEVV